MHTSVIQYVDGVLSLLVSRNSFSGCDDNIGYTVSQLGSASWIPLFHLDSQLYMSLFIGVLGFGQLL